MSQGIDERLCAVETGPGQGTGALGFHPDTVKDSQ